MILPIAVAVTTLLAGVSLFLYSTRAFSSHQHTGTLIAWLLIALTPVFLVFAFFPSSTASGTFQGISVGGAFAAFVLIWVYGSRRSARLRSADQLEEALKAERAQVDELCSEIVRLTAEQGPMVLPEQRVIRYGLPGRSRRIIALVTGDVMNVDFVDLWVNSENTNMQMSRFYEGTISATIRYYGSRRDEKGEVLDDIIGKELSAIMSEATSVAPGTVLATHAGELTRTNKVRVILHVASVFGQPGIGYTRVNDISRCVTNALNFAEDQLEVHHPKPESIMFPLLGTGTGKAGLEPTVKMLFAAAISWLTSTRSTNISTVYFLAYRDSELRVCQKVLADSGQVLLLET